MELNRNLGQSEPQPLEQTPQSKGLDPSLDNHLPVAGAVPPPPPANETATPAERAPKEGLTTQPGGQLDTIKGIKADPKAREEWYANLDEAVKNSEIKMPNIIVTLKTKPENLSKSAAQMLLHYAPMKNPNGPPTDSQLEKATQAHEHMVRSTDLNARVKAEMPAVYEKLQAGSVDDLTKAEASQFISTERAYNREISNRKATPEQVKMIETLLQEHPDLYEGLKAGRELAAGEKAVARYKEAQEAGELTHGMVQDLLQVVHDRIREDAKTNLNQAVDLMKSLTPEDLTFVTQATLTRMQVKKGSPLQGEAEKYVSDYIRVLVDPAAEQANLVAAEKYFLKLERAQVLREAAQEFASV